MKKSVALVLSLVMMAGLVGCRAKDINSGEGETRVKQEVSKAQDETKQETAGEIGTTEGSGVNIWDVIDSQINYQPYDFGGAEFIKPSGNPEIPEDAEILFEDKKLVDCRDFELNIEGVKYEGDNAHLIYSLFSKCKSNLIIRTDLVVNGVTAGFLSATFEPGDYYLGTCIIYMDKVALTGSDKIDSIGTGVIDVIYGDEIDNYSYTLISNKRLGEDKTYENISKQAGAQQVYSDDICDVDVTQIKKMVGNRQFKGLAIYINNKSDKFVANVTLEVPNYDTDISKVTSNCNSYGYGELFIESDEDIEDVLNTSIRIQNDTARMHIDTVKYLTDFARATVIE